MKHSIILAASLLATAAFAQQRPLTAGQPFVADRTAAFGSRAPTVFDRTVRLKNGQTSAAAKPAHKPEPAQSQAPTITNATRADALAFVEANASGGSVSLTGDTYQPAASSAYAPPAHGPLASCRLYVGVGGSSVSRSGSGGIPIGNDQTCLTDAQIALMDTMNQRAPGSFKTADYLRAACAVEGMSKMSGCAGVPSLTPTVEIQAP